MFILIITFVLQACSTGGSSSEDENKKEDKSSLKIAVSSDATTLNPHFATTIADGNFFHQKIYEPLITLNEDTELVPGLADDWESIDELTWEFTLKENISFHDGAPFNADAVKISFDYIIDPDNNSPHYVKYNVIDKVEVIDDNTVQFHLVEPYTPILSILASAESGIVSPKSIEDDPDSLEGNPVGTGPFEFVSWDTGQSVIMKKNEDYWGTISNLDEIIFEIVPENSTRIAMVESDEAQIADAIPVEQFDRIENSESMDVYKREGLATEFLGFNLDKAPFDNIEFRKAVSHAIDRESIISGIYENSGNLANSAMTPNVFGYSDKITPYNYDVNKAKELLEESGIDTEQEITLLTDEKPERVGSAEVIEAQLRELGLNIKIQKMETGAYIDATYNGEHHMFLGGWGNATGDGDYNQYNLFHSDSIGPTGNRFWYSNPEADDIIEEARRVEDEDKRLELYEEVQTMEIEDAVYVPINDAENTLIYSSSIDGIWMTAANQIMTGDVTME